MYFIVNNAFSIEVTIFFSHHYSLFRMIVDSQLVWVRDSSDGYIQGHISEIGPAEFEVIPIDRKYPKRICSVDDIFPSCDGPQDHDDNCMK